MTKLMEYLHTDWEAMTRNDWIGMVLTILAFVAMIAVYVLVFNPRNKEAFDAQGKAVRMTMASTTILEARMSDKHHTESAETTTGHVWDDNLAEYTNQPPRWWMIGLAASKLWCVVYFIMYPSIPLPVTGTFTKGVGVPGAGEWTAIKELEADQKEVDDARSKFEKKKVFLWPTG